MLGTTLLLAFPILPLVLPALSAANSPLLFPLILIITLVLSVACSYLQSAVFALSALWGSGEIFAVMSGQGAIAVIVSAVQFVLAVASSGRDTDGSHSTLAAVGLWGLGALGSLGCLYALRVLVVHPAYASVLAPLAHRRQEGTASGTKGKQVMWRVFRKNTRIEFAVAFVFIVTLVRSDDHGDVTHATGNLPAHHHDDSVGLLLGQCPVAVSVYLAPLPYLQLWVARNEPCLTHQWRTTPDERLYLLCPSRATSRLRLLSGCPCRASSSSPSSCCAIRLAAQPRTSRCSLTACTLSFSSPLA